MHTYIHGAGTDHLINVWRG